MKYSEAINNIRNFETKEMNGIELLKEDRILFVESLKFLIDNCSSDAEKVKFLMHLGGYYYELKEFNLAEKYYLLASSLSKVDPLPSNNLGYIYYYGRTGEPNYEKAFKYFKKANELSSIVDDETSWIYFQSSYKLADMYKNGYYVKKDLKKYEQIIIDLYKDYNKYDKPILNEFKPELFSRIGSIYLNKGDKKQALDFLLKARQALESRMTCNSFFGYFTIMKIIINQIYQIVNLDLDNLNLFDLYELSKKECSLKIEYNKKEYIFKAILEEGTIVINFNNDWFHSIDKFFYNAKIDNKKISTLNDDIKIREIVYERIN